MELIKISEGCYFTSYDTEKDRPTLGYIEGSKYSIMVDAGASQFHVQDYERLLSQTDLKEPALCVITHWHWDHTYGMHALKIPSVVLEETDEKLKEMQTWSWNDKAMKQRLKDKIDIEFADEHIRKEYKMLDDIKVVRGDIIFSDCLTFDLGKRSVFVQHVPSSHSEDSVIVYVKEDKVVYVGDAISVDYYNDNYLDKDKMKLLKEALERLDFDICVTGHNDPIDKDHLMDVMERLSQ